MPDEQSTRDLIDAINRFTGALVSGAGPSGGNAAFQARRGAFQSGVIDSILANEGASLQSNVLDQLGLSKSGPLTNMAGILGGSGIMGNGNLVTSFNALQNGAAIGGMQIGGGASPFTNRGPGMGTDLIAQTVLQTITGTPGKDGQKGMAGFMGFGNVLSGGGNREEMANVAGYMMKQGAFRGTRFEFDENNQLQFAGGISNQTGKEISGTQMRDQVKDTIASGTRLLSSMKEMLGDIGDENLIKEAEALTGMRMNTQANASRMASVVSQLKANAAGSGMTSEAYFMMQKTVIGAGVNAATDSFGPGARNLAYTAMGIMAPDIARGAAASATALENSSGFQQDSTTLARVVGGAVGRRFAGDRGYQDILVAAATSNDENEKARLHDLARDYRRGMVQGGQARVDAQQRTQKALQGVYGEDYSLGDQSRNMDQDYLDQLVQQEQELTRAYGEAAKAEGRLNPENYREAARMTTQMGIFNDEKTANKALRRLYNFSSDVDTQKSVLRDIYSGMSEDDLVKKWGDQMGGTEEARRGMARQLKQASRELLSGGADENTIIRGLTLAGGSMNLFGIEGVADLAKQNAAAFDQMVKVNPVIGEKKMSAAEALSRGIGGAYTVTAGKVQELLPDQDEGVVTFKRGKDGGIRAADADEFNDFTKLLRRSMGDKEYEALEKKHGGAEGLRKYAASKGGAGDLLNRIKGGQATLQTWDEETGTFNIYGEDALEQARGKMDEAQKAQMDEQLKKRKEGGEDGEKTGKDAGGAVQGELDKQTITAEKLEASNLIISGMDFGSMAINMFKAMRA